MRRQKPTVVILVHPHQSPEIPSPLRRLLPRLHDRPEMRPMPPRRRNPQLVEQMEIHHLIQRKGITRPVLPQVLRDHRRPLLRITVPVLIDRIELITFVKIELERPLPIARTSRPARRVPPVRSLQPVRNVIVHHPVAHKTRLPVLEIPTRPCRQPLRRIVVIRHTLIVIRLPRQKMIDRQLLQIRRTRPLVRRHPVIHKTRKVQ